MEILTCMSPEELVEMLKAGNHSVLAYDPNMIVTLADKVYVFLLNAQSMLWCHVDNSVSS